MKTLELLLDATDQNSNYNLYTIDENNNLITHSEGNSIHENLGLITDELINSEYKEYLDWCDKVYL